MPDHRKQIHPLVKKQIRRIINPVKIEAAPPKRWLFFQVVSFLMLQGVLTPMKEFKRNFGIIFPVIIIVIPKMPKRS